MPVSTGCRDPVLTSSDEVYMKYIMFKQEQGDLSKLIPVIFPNDLVHADVAKALQQSVLKGHSIVSAGSISPLNLEAEGRSETLGVESNPIVDSHVIKMNDYGVGYL